MAYQPLSKNPGSAPGSNVYCGYALDCVSTLNINRHTVWLRHHHVTDMCTLSASCTLKLTLTKCTVEMVFSLVLVTNPSHVLQILSPIHTMKLLSATFVCDFCVFHTLLYRR